MFVCLELFTQLYTDNSKPPFISFIYHRFSLELLHQYHSALSWRFLTLINFSHEPPLITCTVTSIFLSFTLMFPHSIYFTHTSLLVQFARTVTSISVSVILMISTSIYFSHTPLLLACSFTSKRLGFILVIPYFVHFSHTRLPLHELFHQYHSALSWWFQKFINFSHTPPLHVWTVKYISVGFILKMFTRIYVSHTTALLTVTISLHLYTRVNTCLRALAK